MQRKTNMKALFLDRDGVINVDKEYLVKPEEFEFMPGIFELCQAFLNKGYLIFIVTNQSGIARGYYTEDDFLTLTDWMLAEFKKRNILIQKVYHCPFHPEYGNKQYRQDSPDRKPHPGMLLKAQKEFSLDLAQSVMIGDKESDILCGLNAGVQTTVLIRSEYYKKGIPATMVVGDLSEALEGLVRILSVG